MKTDSPVIFYVTEKGRSLAGRIAGFYSGAQVLKFDTNQVAHLWDKHSSFIFIMAMGIVVRSISPLLGDKRTDPAVVVLNEKGDHVVSVLSGHIGGANDLARRIASLIGAEAVITTASDINNLPSIDLWASENGLVIENWDALPHVATRLMNEEQLRIYSEPDFPLPKAFIREDDPRHADILVTKKERIEICSSCVKDQLYLRPQNLIVGIGCNRGTSAQEIESAVKAVLLEHNLSFLSIHSLATVDVKAGEHGLLEFSRQYDLSIKAFSAGELNEVSGIEKSDIVFRAVGANAVAEPASLLASGTMKPLVPKQKVGNVTVAVALRKAESENKTEARIGEGMDMKCGKLYIVGIGPGSAEYITPRAIKAIHDADVIVGYDTYIDLVRNLISGKEIFSTGMTKEIDRCAKAVDLALSGKKVAVISGGDPGIYAMAGLVFEILKNAVGAYGDTPLPVVEIVPGISALNAAASRLGAPLMHDFASISLSDRLTPWELIEKRLDAAASADFVIVLYNPKSRGRVGHLDRAVEIISKYRKPETPVGIVKAAMREGEQMTVSDLAGVLDADVDMQTTVIIGNSKTYIWNGRIITPRGYESKLSSL